MRTVIFQSVRDQILRMMGWNPAVVSALQLERCVAFMQCNTRQGWEYGFFPEWTVLEERTPVSQVIAYEQAGQTKMGEIAAVYPYQPDALRDLADGSGRRMAYTLGSDGITILDDLPASGTAWVRFRLQFPRFSTAIYAGGISPIAGYVVMWPNNSTDEQQGGDCYMATQDAQGAWSWVLQPFPAILEQFVVMKTMADLLRTEAQPERAAAYEADAADEIIRVWRAEGGQQQLLQRTRFRGCY